MNNSVQVIPFTNLALTFIPVFVVVGICYKWSQNYRNVLYAVSRMLVQLLLIGYFLTYIFDSDSALVVLVVLAIMVFASSWIALCSIKMQRRKLYTKALFSIILGGGITLFWFFRKIVENHQTSVIE